MKRIDLHTHSTYSDGTLTPRELFKLAHERGVAAVSLTDHDSIDGLHDAVSASQEYDVEFINGVELSAVTDGHEIHILGYFLHGSADELQRQLVELRQARLERNMEMIDSLKKSGVDISYEELQPNAHTQITRMHFAKFLIEKRYTGSIQESFNKYLSPGCKTYVPKKTFTAEKCISLIKSAKGSAVLAHPLRYGLALPDVALLVKKLALSGIDGIEAIYPSHCIYDEKSLRRLAAKYGLIVTGGSDFHGSVKPNINLGDGTDKTMIPYSVLDGLRAISDCFYDIP